MNINISTKTAKNWSGDGLAIAAFTTEGELSPDIMSLDREVLAGTIAELVSETEFTGEAGMVASARVGASSPIRKIMLVGMGEPAKATTDTWRKAAAQAAKWADSAKCKTLALWFPTYNLDESITAQAMTEGAILSMHRDTRFKSSYDNGNSDQLVLATIDFLGLTPSTATEGTERALKICSGAIAAREMVSAPANIVTPAYLAQEAIAIAESCPDCMSIEVLEKEQCAALGMGAFLGVSQASDLPPKFIHLTYNGGKNSGAEVSRKLAIIGKGVTFDSGGLNIKAGPNSGIAMMKTDMGGAAATLGAAKAIAQLKPEDVEVHFIVAACENMISGKAIHPGDILTASNGKTIEVNNTDAEGRLTLADALVFADKLGLDAIVDLATLTGACVVALGNDIAGLWSTSDDLAAQITTASKLAGEKFWRMPLEEPYFEVMKSVVADFKNTGARPGGSITVALFLKQFVENTPEWAHLDVAGPVWTEKESEYINPGGTGYPVRTLVNLVLDE